MHLCQTMQFKKCVALGRCVPPTCAHVDWHHPTPFQTWLLFPLIMYDCQQRHVHKIVHQCIWNCNAQKVSWLRCGVFVDVINFEIELNVSVFSLSLNFWRLGAMQVPIGRVMEEWKLEYQVLQFCINPSQRKFQKGHSFLLKLVPKGLVRIKEINFQTT